MTVRQGGDNDFSGASTTLSDRKTTLSDRKTIHSQPFAFIINKNYFKIGQPALSRYFESLFEKFLFPYKSLLLCNQYLQKNKVVL